MNKLILCLLYGFVLSGSIAAQVKRKAHSSKPIKMVSLAPEPAFNNVYFVTDYKDVNLAGIYYAALKEMTENYSFSFAFADNTFRPNQLVKRGEFCYYLDQLYEKIQNYKTAAGIDTTLINSYDPNRSYITEVSKISDLNSSSVYYGPVKSMIEDFGVAAPFKKDKRLNALGTISEKEVYDILHVTLDYSNMEFMPSLKPVTRGRFVTFLHGALVNMVDRIASLGTKKKE